MQKPQRYKLNTTSFDYYWKDGIGRNLLKKLNKTLDLAKADEFIPYLFEYDQLADELVHQLHQKIGFVKAQQLVEDFIAQRPIPNKEHEQHLKNFFDGITVAPEWLDRTLIQKGLEFSQRSAISGLVVLRDYCLMGGYESAAINKPLIYTGALKKGAAKRLTETTVFWVDLTKDEGLEVGNPGFNAVIKTRLIHAFSRVNILKSTDWETQKWGIPLNTWDMLATNLGFSLVYMIGLKRMGIVADVQEVKGIFHLWKYVGFLLGIPLHLLPDTEEEAIEALYYWTMTQAEGDADTLLLAKALQEEPVHAFYPKSKIGRKFMREVHLYYNHFLLGDYSCDLLGLDKTTIGNLAALSVLMNKRQAKGLQKGQNRLKAIQKGRAAHERVKQIYLEFNSK